MLYDTIEVLLAYVLTTVSATGRLIGKVKG